MRPATSSRCYEICMWHALPDIVKPSWIVLHTLNRVWCMRERSQREVTKFTIKKQPGLAHTWFTNLIKWIDCYNLAYKNLGAQRIVLVAWRKSLYVNAHAQDSDTWTILEIIEKSVGPFSRYIYFALLCCRDTHVCMDVTPYNVVEMTVPK